MPETTPAPAPWDGRPPGDAARRDGWWWIRDSDGDLLPTQWMGGYWQFGGGQWTPERVAAAGDQLVGPALTPAEHRAALAAAWEAGREAAVRVAERASWLPGDCEHLGIMDPETGVRECALDLLDAVCPCFGRSDAIKYIVTAIRALPNPHREAGA